MRNLRDQRALHWTGFPSLYGGHFPDSAERSAKKINIKHVKGSPKQHQLEFQRKISTLTVTAGGCPATEVFKIVC